MIARFRTRAAGLAILAPALLSACSPAPTPVASVNIPTAAVPPAPNAKPAVFTLDTPVERIAANPQGRAVLDRDVPGLMSDKRYPMFDDMSLSEIAVFSNGRLSKSRLALVESDLNLISYLSPDAASAAAVTSPVQ